MLPGGGGVVARGKLFDHLDIRGQSGPREDSLEQIVTENDALGEAAVEGGFEGVHIVNSLAAVRTFAEEILIDVGDREGIGVQSARTCKDALEQRPLTPARQRRGNARLQHRIALDHAVAIRIQPRPVERMRHFADQAPGGSARQPGIGVERDHVTNAGRYVGR